MSLFASFDLELPDDPDFLALEGLNPAWPWWFFRLVQAAKRYNCKGLVCNAGGRPLRARDLAIVHHRSVQREQDWAEMIDACVSLGLLEDEGGVYRITNWRRWHRSPSDEPEATRARKQESRDRQARHEASREVTNGHGCHETEQSRAEHSRAEHAPPTPPGGEPAAAQVEDEPESEPEALPAPPPHQARPAADGGVLESTRPQVGQAMQDLGILGTPTGHWWTLYAEWAGPGLGLGATVEDLLTALTFGRDKAIHDRPNRRWPYAMRIAAEELGNVVARRKLTDEARARGRPLPRPYRFEPPPLPTEAKVTSSEALHRGGGRC